MGRSFSLTGMPALLLTLLASQPAHGCPEGAAADCPSATGADGWVTNHPGLIYTGAIFGAASLVNFGVVGGYSGEQPDEIFYLALTSGAVHYAVGVSLLTAGIVLDDSEDAEPALQPKVAVAPTGAMLRWSF